MAAAGSSANWSRCSRIGWMLPPAPFTTAMIGFPSGSILCRFGQIKSMHCGRAVVRGPTHARRREAVIDPGMPTDTDSLRKVASRLGLDEANLNELLDDVASARRAYRMYE